jgi:hypothetical protein
MKSIPFSANPVRDLSLNGQTRAIMPHVSLPVKKAEDFLTGSSPIEMSYIRLSQNDLNVTLFLLP